METTEKIVDSYCRYVKGWFTIPNVKCKSQYEIDLLAVDISGPEGIKRYHIECGVSISGSYSKLTAKEFSREDLKKRIQQAGQRRTIGYFIERKFGQQEVHDKLREYGFGADRHNYQKVIVTWGWTDDAKQAADREDIILWDFRQVLREIAAAFKTQRTYFTDDTLRTIQLFAKSVDEAHKAGRA
ncbi:MAG TPA: hypothetical protein VM163_08805 [bacterium]|nr:hypothetical protein [bacterium]